MLADASAIGAVLSSIKTAQDILRAGLSVRDSVVAGSKLAELTSQLVEAGNRALLAQQEQSALLDRVATLEKECVQLRERQRERERYGLKEVYPGSYALARKPSDSDTSSPHWLCQNCFDGGQNIVLQSRHGERSWRVWFCPSCKTEFRTNPAVSPSNPFSPKGGTP